MGEASAASESFKLLFHDLGWLIGFIGFGLLVPFLLELKGVIKGWTSHMPIVTASVLVMVGGYLLRSLGPLTVLEGRLEQRSGEPGSKSEGETWPVLSVAGVDYQLFNPDVVPEAPGTELTVRARPVERSPVVTHRGGRWLWVLKAERVSR